eukprot:1144967-Pelagomonas_calceolata.AAC.1
MVDLADNPHTREEQVSSRVCLISYAQDHLLYDTAGSERLSSRLHAKSILVGAHVLEEQASSLRFSF